MDLQECLSVAKDFYALCTQVWNLGMKVLLDTDHIGMVCCAKLWHICHLIDSLFSSAEFPVEKGQTSTLTTDRTSSSTSAGQYQQSFRYMSKPTMTGSTNKWVWLLKQSRNAAHNSCLPVSLSCCIVATSACRCSAIAI